MRRKIFGRQLIFKAWCLLALLPAVVMPAPAARATDTSLLFVGEDLSVLTIASRRAESPQEAPAVAEVISRETLERYGIRTLGEALDMLPGFNLVDREWGSQPFLRGVSDSVLFLYDSVPLTSDSTKSIHPLDEELSLAAVERIEVIRGPGSVLWGPDAFAGIVNIVPRRGRNIDGVEMTARGGSPTHEENLSLSWGRNAGLWEAFVSLSATRLDPWRTKFNVLKFPESPAPSPEDRLGAAHVDKEEFGEAVLNFSWKDWLRVSARWSEEDRPYVTGDPEKGLSWAGKRDVPFKFVRFEMERPVDKARLRFNAYYNQLDFEEREVDFSWSQKNQVSYGEALYERELWGAGGLLTLGASYRYNRIRGARVDQDLLPDFLKPGKVIFVPSLRQENFSTSLKSVFGQIRRHWSRFNAWAGFRYDDHNQYSSTISHNLGIGWRPRAPWNVKILYGTSYRTPYNKKLFDEQKLFSESGLDPERAQNFSVHVNWRPLTELKLSATAFWNRIKDHIREDPYGGFSNPGDQDIYGIELEARWQPAAGLKLWANGTFFTNTGDDNFFQKEDFLILPGLPPRPIVTSYATPFETASENLINAGVSWDPRPWLNFSSRLSYRDSATYFYLQGENRTPLDSYWTLDSTITARDIPWDGVDIQLAVKNLFNDSHQSPGTYSETEGAPFAAYLGLRWRF